MHSSYSHSPVLDLPHPFTKASNLFCFPNFISIGGRVRGYNELFQYSVRVLAF